MLLEDGDVVFVQMTDDEKAQFLAEVERRMDAKLAMQKVTVERRVQRPRSRMTYLKPEHFPHLYGYAPASDPEDDLKDEQVGQKPEDVIPENELANDALPSPPLPAKSKGKSSFLSLKPPKIELPSPAASDLRRSTRTKMPPVNDWAGQRVIYERDENGLESVAGVSTPKIDSRRRSQYTAGLKYKEIAFDSGSD
ncbi:hypothetical protein DdX_19948 [Ditylenchus destructor]|uniref:Uncharacterized protein n=1 Tax=Ditylenchus destructor TaxID=166010 RepID=A0AAD4MH43_9BILA|nr:hypothetical protein DdX_19948 [Ditylenchus destructor]